MAQLTVREDEVGRLAAEGLSNDEIASSLGVSRRTVETHLRAVFRKAGVRRRTQLARWYQQDNKIVNGPSGLQPARITKTNDLTPTRRRRSPTEYEQELRRYANAVHGLVDRQFPLFEERVEITLMVGEQDGQDIVSERRWTSPRPYLIYRILGPIVTGPDGPPFELDDLEPACHVNGQDTQVHIHPVRDVGGRPLLMILFQPGLHDDTEWVLSYRSPRLWDPLRSSGQDELSWATATLDERHPATTSELTFKVIFPASWTGERLTEQSNLGEIHTGRLPTGRTQVTWHHDTPHASAYHWVLHGSAAN
ncbi:MAG: response regulator transcription factor [Pseudonocardiaceae bacterium]